MKTNNPQSRFRLSVSKLDHVLEVGSGHNPHPRSNVLVDKFVTNNYHRSQNIRKFKHQRFVNADGEELPFKDSEFEYVICIHVLEHVESPDKFVAELARVANRGYIETPSLIGEYLFPKESHKWVILEIEDKLILMEKEKIWFDTNLDFGYLFLTWLQKNSLAFKILRGTHPNIFTVRYEWKDSIEILINPPEEKYRRFFTQAWNREMVKLFFDERPKPREVLHSFTAVFRMMFSNFKLRQNEKRLEFLE